jgi:altronate dehydratase small subunit
MTMSGQETAEKTVFILVMHEKDNVGIAARELKQGDTVSLTTPSVCIEVKEDIPFGFKIALKDIQAQQIISKYGEPIGRAAKPIQQGHMVHVHNMEGCRGRGDI